MMKNLLKDDPSKIIQWMKEGEENRAGPVFTQNLQGGKTI
jgi:hypothetical protein